jgi:hypothetical protein
MRWIGLGLVGMLGCATVEPFVVSDQQRAHFEQVLQSAERATADGPPEAAALLADARSDFEYAQHLPKYPERARGLAAKAQHEAETALWMAQQAHRQAEVAARRAASAAEATGPAAVALP